MIKCTFHKDIKLDHIFFDNNCTLAGMVQDGKDPFFDDIGLTVDVFHFKCKHSETNLFCQRNCNPAAYPKLISEDNQGWFSTHQLQSRQTCGLEATTQFVERCSWISIHFSWMRWSCKGTTWWRRSLQRRGGPHRTGPTLTRIWHCNHYDTQYMSWGSTYL